MKCGSQMAVAVVGGYVLGRSRKTRLAMLLALMAAAGGKLPVGPEDLLRKPPLGGQLDKLTGELRSHLVDADVSVAMMAASSRIDSLSDRLQERAETMRAGTRGREETEEDEQAPERARPRRERGEPSRRRREEPGRREREEPSRRGRGREPEDDEDEDEERGGYEPERRPRQDRRPPARSSRPEPRRRAPRREDDRPRRGRSPL